MTLSSPRFLCKTSMGFSIRRPCKGEDDRRTGPRTAAWGGANETPRDPAKLLLFFSGLLAISPPQLFAPSVKGSSASGIRPAAGRTASRGRGVRIVRRQARRPERFRRGGRRRSPTVRVRAVRPGNARGGMARGLADAATPTHPRRKRPETKESGDGEEQMEKAVPGSVDGLAGWTGLHGVSGAGVVPGRPVLAIRPAERDRPKHCGVRPDDDGQEPVAGHPHRGASDQGYGDGRRCAPRPPLFGGRSASAAAGAVGLPGPGQAGRGQDRSARASEGRPGPGRGRRPAAAGGARSRAAHCRCPPRRPRPRCRHTSSSRPMCCSSTASV